MNDEKITTLARPRINDSVEDDLGNYSERKLKEKENAEQAAAHILINGLKRSDEISKRGMKKYPLAFSAGAESELQKQQITFQDAESRRTLKRVWEQKQKELTATIISDEGDEYSKLGNTVADVDI